MLLGNRSAHAEEAYRDRGEISAKGEISANGEISARGEMCAN